MLLQLLPLVASALALLFPPQLLVRALPVIPVLGFGVIADPSGHTASVWSWSGIHAAAPHPVHSDMQVMQDGCWPALTMQWSA